MQSRKILVVGMGCAIALTACQSTLETQKIAEDIQSELRQKGLTSLQSVACPETVEKQARVSFDCVGELENKSRFKVVVTLKDEAGAVDWSVDNSKVVLNVAKLQQTFQAALQPVGGTPPQLDCGAAYRPNKPGETFECKVLDPKQPKSLLVTVEPDGNVSWNEIIEAPIASTTKGSGPATTQSGTAPAATPAQNSPQPQPSPGSAPSGQTADDFLNQPGALDNLAD